MRAAACAVVIAASLSAGAAALAACPPSKTRNCIDFNAVPQISQDVVASEPTAKVPKKGWEPDKKGAYTGPTVGAVPGVHRAPEVGYRWAIN